MKFLDYLYYRFYIWGESKAKKHKRAKLYKYDAMPIVGTAYLSILSPIIFGICRLVELSFPKYPKLYLVVFWFLSCLVYICVGIRILKKKNSIMHKFKYNKWNKRIKHIFVIRLIVLVIMFAGFFLGMMTTAYLESLIK